MEGLAEMGLSAGLEVGGGTALATPEPNLPEFKICNEGSGCQKECVKGGRKEESTFFTCGVGGPEAPLVG